MSADADNRLSQPSPGPGASASWRDVALTIAAMLVAVGTVALVAYRTELQDAEAALADFQRTQATLASSAALALEAALASVQRDAEGVAEIEADGGSVPSSIASRYVSFRIRGPGEPALSLPGSPSIVVLSVALPDRKQVVDLAVSLSRLLGGVERVQSPNALSWLLLPPSATAFRLADGRALENASLLAALRNGVRSLRLSRADAPRFGLPARTAAAGLAQVDAGLLGRWGVAAVATAMRERDRELHAQQRLLRSVLLTSMVVLGFGGLALRTMRKQLALQHELAMATLQRQRDERLERASKVATMGTLAMGVAHEVSTPLGVILGRAEQLLPRVADDERAARGVRVIIEQGERIHQIIRSFLSMARGDSPPASRVEPEAVARGAFELVEHRFGEAGVRLQLDVAPELPLLHGDLRLLQHALTNLLRNACDACARGGRVDVAIRASGERVGFVVEDDGHGIPQAVAALATEPFITTKHHGTGLGLAIATEIVKGHGGSLTLTPRKPSGTRAVIELPGAKRESHAAA